MTKKDIFKFKVWDIKKKKMHDSDDPNNDFVINASGQLKMICYAGDFAGEPRFLIKDVDESKFTKRISTGLRDTNEKLIFEGDIVKITNEIDSFDNFSGIDSIEFSEKDGTWTLPKFGKCLSDIYFYNSEYDFLIKSVKIIGNIYENTKLLTTKRKK